MKSLMAVDRREKHNSSVRPTICDDIWFDQIVAILLAVLLLFPPDRHKKAEF